MTRKLMQLFAITATLFMLSASAAFGTTTISNVVTTPTSPASLVFNDSVYVDFNYTTDESGGVKIFIRPFTDGTITPNYVAHVGLTCPIGSGSNTGWFKITSGTVIVDSLRFQIWNSTQTTLLDEIFFPVEFHYSTNAIKNIVITPTSPASLIFNDTVDITFDYETDVSEGVRIFSLPFADGSIALNSIYSGSPTYSVGTGSGDNLFRITLGEVTIDSIRFKMTNLDQSVVLLEFYVPVEYHYSTHAIKNVVFTPASPDTLEFGNNVDITFDYETDEAGGVRIWTYPYTNGSATPNYAHGGSILYPTGSGSGSNYVLVLSGEVVVDSVKFEMWTDGQTSLLLEYFIPVHYKYDSGSPAGPFSHEPTRPKSFTLSQNYPNPFNPSTEIEYEILVKSHVTITVFNALGQKVTTLVDGTMDLGPHSVIWDGMDSNGNQMPAGVYFYKFQSEDGSVTKKMILLK